MGFSDKMTVFFDDVGHCFETSVWIIFFFTKTNIMCQILSKSDASRKKSGT